MGAAAGHAYASGGSGGASVHPSLWLRNDTRANSGQDKFGERLAICAVPCNQFGHQKPGWPEEVRVCTPRCQAR